MPNVYQQFRDLLPEAPLQVGTVADVTPGAITVVLPGGGVVHARGEGTVGQKVFVRAGVIEAVAPDLPIEIISV